MRERKKQFLWKEKHLFTFPCPMFSWIFFFLLYFWVYACESTATTKWWVPVHVTLEVCTGPARPILNWSWSPSILGSRGTKLSSMPGSGLSQVHRKLASNSMAHAYFDNLLFLLNSLNLFCFVFANGRQKIIPNFLMMKDILLFVFTFLILAIFGIGGSLVALQRTSNI